MSEDMDMPELESEQMTFEGTAVILQEFTVKGVAGVLDTKHQFGLEGLPKGTRVRVVLTGTVVEVHFKGVNKLPGLVRKHVIKVGDTDAAEVTEILSDRPK